MKHTTYHFLKLVCRSGSKRPGIIVKLDHQKYVAWTVTSDRFLSSVIRGFLIVRNTRSLYDWRPAFSRFVGGKFDSEGKNPTAESPNIFEQNLDKNPQKQTKHRKGQVRCYLFDVTRRPAAMKYVGSAGTSFE